MANAYDTTYLEQYIGNSTTLSAISQTTSTGDSRFAEMMTPTGAAAIETAPYAGTRFVGQIIVSAMGTVSIPLYYGAEAEVLDTLRDQDDLFYVAIQTQVPEAHAFPCVYPGTPIAGPTANLVRSTLEVSERGNPVDGGYRAGMNDIRKFDLVGSQESSDTLDAAAGDDLYVVVYAQADTPQQLQIKSGADVLNNTLNIGSTGIHKATPATGKAWTSGMKLELAGSTQNTCSIWAVAKPPATIAEGN